jgi:hypothetical protein
MHVKESATNNIQQHAAIINMNFRVLFFLPHIFRKESGGDMSYAV